jgi:hypothetical protein
MNIGIARDEFLKWGIRIVSTLIFFMVMLCVYWLVIDRFEPIQVERGEVVRYDEQQDGSWVMFVKWYGQRNRRCWGTSKRWLAGETLLPLEDIPYPPENQNTPFGPYQWEVPVYIPQYFVRTGHIKGEYRIRIFFACNPLQEHIFPIAIEPPPVAFELPVAYSRGKR